MRRDDGFLSPVEEEEGGGEGKVWQEDVDAGGMNEEEEVGGWETAGLTGQEEEEEA